MANERDILLQFLNMYRNMPCLWDRSHPDYKNKAVRANVSLELLNVYKEFDAEATIPTMNKKIQDLRSNYFKQLKRLKSARNKREVFRPTSWYFHALQFLGDKGDNYQSNWGPMEIEILSSSDDEERKQAEICDTPPAMMQKVTSTVSQDTSDDNESVGEVSHVINKEWDIIGRSIVLQMQDLDTKQLTITQKLIADAIYYAKFGLLTENSHVSLGAEPHPP